MCEYKRQGAVERKSALAKGILLLIMILLLPAGACAGGALVLNAEPCRIDYHFQTEEQFVLLNWSAPKQAGKQVLYSADGTFEGSIPLSESGAGGACTVTVEKLTHSRLMSGRVTVPADPAWQKPTGKARGRIADLSVEGTEDGFHYSFTAPGTDYFQLHYRTATQSGFHIVRPTDSEGHYEGEVSLPFTFARNSITVKLCNEQGVAASKETRTQKGYRIQPVPEQGEGRLSGIVVCIDPGHQEMSGDQRTQVTLREPLGPGLRGMVDGVGGSAEGKWTMRREAIVTLQVAFRLREILVSQGAVVVMTRDRQDVFHTNIQRCEIAAEADAFIMLRLHCNSRRDRNAYGIQVYGPLNSDYARALASREEYQAMGELMLGAIKHAVGYPEGKQSGTVHLNDNYVGNNWARMFCFLIEMGYMSNQREDWLLSSDVYQTWLAEGMAEGVYQIALAQGATQQ